MFDFRVTPAQVLAAYEKTGMLPTRGAMHVVIGDQVCGCGLGAMFVAEFGRSPYIDDQGEQVGLRYNAYLEAFIDGFDARYQFASLNPIAVVGKIDGRDCARAVFGTADK